MHKKFKLFSKTFLIILGATAGIGAIVSAVAYKLSQDFKPSFYNYRSYMSPANIQKISNVFEYKQFNEINEFSTALISNRAVAGIGSDFQAVNLIKKGKLAKINYSKLLNLPDLKEENYEDAVKSIVRPFIWEHLKAYDEELKTDEFGVAYSTPKHLWQYFMPYFSQDAVIAYNILKNPIKTENLLDQESGQLNFEKYRTNNSNPYQMINILKILSENGFNNWVITDAMRDNLLYGSAYYINLQNQTRDDNQFTGKVFEDTYKTLVDNFTALIKDGTGFSVNDTNHINFKGDGLELLNDLINPNSKVNAAIMYNGDAIDAYYSEDNFQDVEEGSAIRIVRPSKNILLLDGLVISSANQDESVERFSQITGETIFKNASLIYKTKIENPNLTMEQIKEKILNNFYLDFKTNEIHDLIAETNSEFSLDSIREYLNNLLILIDKKRIDTSIEDDLDKLNLNAKLMKMYFETKVEELTTDLKNKNLLQANADLERLNQEAKNDLEKSIIISFYKQLIMSSEVDFSKLEQSEINQNLLEQIVNNLAWVSITDGDKNPEWKSKLLTEKYSNLENFDFINYVPSLQIEYDFIERNYFYNNDGTVDDIALDIYRINNSENGESFHTNISAIGDSLSSDVSFYYFQKTKS